MDWGPLAQDIIKAYGSMSPQLQAAARFVLDRPSDVALLSMREQARQAGVQPATMTRLAKQLGLDGYEQVRERYAAAIRSGKIGFAGRVGDQVASQKLRGDKAIAAEMLEGAGRSLAALGTGQQLERIVDLAEHLNAARRIYCLGLRASHAVAWHFHYILSLIGERARLLDGPAGTGADALRHATAKDVVLTVSIAPYTRQTIDLATYAAGRGIPILAITDSAVAPLASIAKCSVVVSTDSPSFFHSMTPAFLVVEILAALVAGREGAAALRSLQRSDRHFAALDIHLQPRNEPVPT